MARKLAEASQALADIDQNIRSEEATKAENERQARLTVKAKAYMATKGCFTGDDYRAYCRRVFNSPDFMRPSPIEHWKRVLAKPNASMTSIEYATEALAKLSAKAEMREPGQDDE